MQSFIGPLLKKCGLFSCCFALCLLAACSSQQTQTPTPGPTNVYTPASNNDSAYLGKNLIINGDAESGPGVTDDGSLAQSIPGWQRQGTFNVVQYDASGGFPTAQDPGPTNRGKNFFDGGPETDANGASVDNTKTSAIQIIDITALATLTDTGTVSYAASGYFGGYSSQGDSAVLSIEFIGGSGQTAVSLGTVTSDERQGNTGLLERYTSGKLPKGTRTIKLTLTMNKQEGSYNDGCADNLSLILRH